MRIRRWSGVCFTAAVFGASIHHAKTRRPNAARKQHQHIDPSDTQLPTPPARAEALRADQKTGLSFAVIGMAKCATTTLHNAINLHPQLFMLPGEPHFFGDEINRDLTRINSSVSAFRASVNITAEARVGFKNPTLVNNELALQLMARMPAFCVILSLRDPLRWFESFYNFRQTEFTVFAEHGFPRSGHPLMNGSCAAMMRDDGLPLPAQLVHLEEPHVGICAGITVKKRFRPAFLLERALNTIRPERIALVTAESLAAQATASRVWEYLAQRLGTAPFPMSVRSVRSNAHHPAAPRQPASLAPKGPRLLDLCSQEASRVRAKLEAIFYSRAEEAHLERGFKAAGTPAPPPPRLQCESE